ncbi:hypothetical protein HDV05_008270, partial [Chytridiales sp. JEL 0842]
MTSPPSASSSYRYPRPLTAFIAHIQSWRSESALQLITSYFFTTWSTRMDEWAVPLMLYSLFPSSLLYVSLYSFLITGLAVIGGPAVGFLVDQMPRITSVTALIAAQKVVIGASALLLFAMDRWVPTATTWGYVLFALVIVCGTVMKLANMGSVIAIEKDWIVVIAGHDSAKLTRYNGHLRRADLICKLGAPLVVSFIASYISIAITMLVVAAWCCLAMVLELLLIRMVYRSNALLSIPKATRRNGVQEEEGDLQLTTTDARSLSQPATEQLSSIPNESTNLQDPQNALTINETNTQQAETAEDAPNTFWAKYFKAWIIYSSQSVVLPALGLAFLYLTTLSFGNVMITYLLSVGYSSVLLSGMRALAVLAGLLATVTLSPVVAKIGLVRAGLWSIFSQVGSLAPVLASFFVAPGSNVFELLSYGITI